MHPGTPDPFLAGPASVPAPGARSRVPGWVRALTALMVALPTALGAAEPAVPGRSLAQCLETALRANASLKVSQAARRVAEEQLAQAQSARWPEVGLAITGTRRDQDPDFLFPASSFSLGPAAGPLAEAMAATQLAKAGVTPASVGTAAFNQQLAGATQATLGQMPGITIPAQDVKLVDRDMLASSLNLQFPIYAGGRIDANIRRGRAGLGAAQAASRAADLQVVQDVRHCYYTAVLSRKLKEIGEEALDRCQMLFELTDRLNRTGSGRVKRTDVLRTQVVVADLKSMVALLGSNAELARTALGNAMGLPWNEQVEPLDREVPLGEYGGDLEALVARARTANPQVLGLDCGIAAAEAGTDLARAGHLPVVVLFGSADRYDTPYHAGLATDSNRRSWTLGLRVLVPVFNGFKVRHEVREAGARKEELGQRRQLLNEGLGVQVKNAFLQIARSLRQVQATAEAAQAARESRELHLQAFQEELVDAKDVVESQLLELFISSQHQVARYDAQVHQAELETLLGRGLDENP